jgi:flagellar basal-body rod modification protein FlgD
MDLTAITNPGAGGVTTTPQDKTGLGKDDFLKLLMAQMSNQDPSAPADSTQFVAQLAQFAGVEQMQGMSSTLQNLLLAQTSSNQTQSINLIGKSVQYKTDKVNFDGTNPPKLYGNLSANAATVTAVISDSTGKVVRTLQVNGAQAGQLSMPWDGHDDKGNVLPPGTYSVKMTAADTGGKSVPVDAQGVGLVTGVSFSKGYPELQVGGATLTLSDIVSVTQTQTPTN